MPNTSRLLPEHIVCKITRRANSCDPALKPLNHEITSDTSLHKQNLWKEHLKLGSQAQHTHTLWKTIHGLSNRAAPTPQNCTITFNKKIATSPKNIVNCFIIIIMFIIYSKERKKNSSNTHTQHRNKLLIYTITLIYKYIHSRKKNMA